MTLKHRIEIYIPRNTSIQEGVLADTFYRFCSMFGGASVIPVLEGWVGSNGEIVTHKIGIIFSYIPEVTTNIKNFLRSIASELRETLSQNAITVVIDNTVEYY